jgi:hypothetical protein
MSHFFQENGLIYLCGVPEDYTLDLSLDLGLVKIPTVGIKFLKLPKGYLALG